MNGPVRIGLSRVTGVGADGFPRYGTRRTLREVGHEPTGVAPRILNIASVPFASDDVKEAGVFLWKLGMRN